MQLLKIEVLLSLFYIFHALHIWPKKQYFFQKYFVNSYIVDIEHWIPNYMAILTSPPNKHILLYYVEINNHIFYNQLAFSIILLVCHLVLITNISQLCKINQ